MVNTKGEIWRVTAASGSATYDLHLVDTNLDKDLIVQVLSIDGVAVSGGVPTSTLTQWLTLNTKTGNLIPCLGVPSGTTNAPVCATRIVMMPASRAELWVAYRDANGNLATPPVTGGKAVLRTVGYDTGGDQWPPHLFWHGAQGQCDRP